MSSSLIDVKILAKSLPPPERVPFMNKGLCNFQKLRPVAFYHPHITVIEVNCLVRKIKSNLTLGLLNPKALFEIL